MAENIVLDFLHNYKTGERRTADPTVYQWDLGRVMVAHVPFNATNIEIHYWQNGEEQSSGYTPDSIAADTDEGGYIITAHVPNFLFQQALDVSVYIVITDDSQDVTTYEGLITVKARPIPDGYVDPDPDNSATNIISTAQELYEEMVSMLGGGIIIVSTVVDMTDTSRVYLYNGTETGYTSGHWYYYDTGTSAWTDGGSYTGWSTAETVIATYLESNAQEVGTLTLVVGSTTYTYNGSSAVSVTIPDATTSASGLMSATDKSHLDSVYADYSSAITALEG